MFRLVKLMAYALLGYAFYEFFVGMTEEGNRSGRHSRRSGGGNPQSRQQRRVSSGGPNLTGRGQGSTTATEDFSGARSTHVVGRGVTH